MTLKDYLCNTKTIGRTLDPNKLNIIIKINDYEPMKYDFNIIDISDLAKFNPVSIINNIADLTPVFCKKSFVEVKYSYKIPKILKILKKYVQPKAFQNVKELFTNDGVALYISLNTIEENEQILSTKISKINKDTGISNLIPESKKTLLINFDMKSSNVLTPGTSVDILNTIEYFVTNRELQKSVFAVAQNVLVLAVGNNYIGAAIKQDYDCGNINIVTLAVSVEEAQKFL
ncbi:MAG: hypothetical protein LBS81_02045 [Endomicrobium sp.]|jgi:hypothetical protein|nr:hypothetical protein [Endomicrobium sp.]